MKPYCALLCIVSAQDPSTIGSYVLKPFEVHAQGPTDVRVWRLAHDQVLCTIVAVMICIIVVLHHVKNSPCLASPDQPWLFLLPGTLGCSGSQNVLLGLSNFALVPAEQSRLVPNFELWLAPGCLPKYDPCWSCKWHCWPQQVLNYTFSIASAVLTGTVDFSTTILLVVDTLAIMRAAPSQ